MGKQKKPWDSVFHRIQGVSSPEFYYPPKPTAVDLDRIEKQLEFQFPASYRAFAEEFGLGGVLLGRARILPLCRVPELPPLYRTDSVLDETRFYRTHAWEDADWISDARDLRRVIVFAAEPGYYEWVFEPGEITNTKHGECRIYEVDRYVDDYSTSATMLAASFDEWLLRIDDRYNFDRDEEPTEPEFRPVFKPRSSHPRPMTYYRSHFPRQKHPPTAKNVTLWLAWNNNTARDLALSIREHGQVDAFPILADALQEAGCTNADLLDSCRTGDPDIDGHWVLQVLLGRAAK